VLVDDVASNSPAYGKLFSRDIITQFNGQQIDTADQLRNAVAATAPNGEVNITVFRHHNYQTVQVTVGTQPADLEAAMGFGGNGGNGGDQPEAVHNAEALGMKLSNLTDDVTKQLGLPANASGAVITSVSPKSAASDAGLREGDVITNVGDDNVTNADDAANALNKIDPNKGVTLTILTSQGSRFVFLQANSNNTGGNQ
jgi:serine protease Do